MCFYTHPLRHRGQAFDIEAAPDRRLLHQIWGNARDAALGGEGRLGSGFEQHLWRWKDTFPFWCERVVDVGTALSYHPAPNRRAAHVMCCIGLTPTNLWSPPASSNTLLLRAQNNDSIRFVDTTGSSFHFPQPFCSPFIILQQIEGWNSPYFLYQHWVQCYWCSGEIQFSLAAACCGATQGCFHFWNLKASVNGSIFPFYLYCSEINIRLGSAWSTDDKQRQAVHVKVLKSLKETPYAVIMQPLPDC